MDSEPANRQPLSSDIDPQFRHEIQRGPEGTSTGIIQSFCMHCDKYVGGTNNPALLAMVERVHRCDLPVRSYPSAA